mgnify:CR=1 FL=1
MISIITVVFNSKKMLKKTIESILDQSYKNIEYVIIDGGSTDGTIDVIKAYEDSIDYWCSSPDKGISHAFNKGLEKASGDIIGILNAGDIFLDDALLHVSKAFEKNNIDFLYANSVLKNQHDNEIRTLIPKTITKFPYGGMPFQHSTLFIKKSVYDIAGNFNVNYKVAMDFELLLRIYKLDYIGHYLDRRLSIYYRGGMSDKNYIRGHLEVLYASLASEEANFIKVLAWALKNIIRTKVRKIIERIT